ncbi:hypothetical protein FSP39_022619, partial [Pinctada imbricata]
QKFGDVKIQIGERPRKVTVFLNPAAATGGALKLFTKNAAPLLHLAGLEVNLVKTEYEGQVKKYLEVLEKKDTDAIVVAGGDGTLLEEFNKKVPIGVIPLGDANRFAKIMYGSDMEQVKFILASTMAVVNGFSKSMDVLKIEGEDGKSTYSMLGLETGAYRDARGKVNKYWYFGPLKYRWTYLRHTLKEWPPLLKAKISYVVATEENMKPKLVKKSQETPTMNKSSWLSFLFGNRPKKSPDIYEETDPDDTGDEVIEEEVTTSELTLMSPFVQQDSHSIKATSAGIGPSELSRTDFIKEGWQRINRGDQKFGCEGNKSMLVKKIKIVPQVPEDSQLWYNIDGENYEAMPIEVRLLRNKINVFYNHVPLPS